MNKLVRSSMIGLSLSLATGCEMVGESASNTKTYEVRQYVDPDIEIKGLGKILCKVSSREPVYKIPFKKHEAEAQLKAVTNLSQATLSAAFEIGTQCTSPLSVSDIERGLGVVVVGDVKDESGNEHQIHEVCLVAGYPITKNQVDTHTNVSVFCPNLLQGYI